MTTLFSMNINPANRIYNIALKAIHQAVLDGSQRDSKPVFRSVLMVILGLLVVTLSCGASADTSPDKPAAMQSATAVDDLHEQDRARQRQAIAEAVRNEKLKMKTEVRDLKNKQRAAGEILGFDVFLGAFLTGLWAMISMFIAAQFSGAKNDGSHNEMARKLKTDQMLFYISGSFMPLMLLWVAVSTGYASWWLALAVSGLIYWLMGGVFGKLKKSIQE